MRVPSNTPHHTLYEMLLVRINGFSSNTFPSRYLFTLPHWEWQTTQSHRNIWAKPLESSFDVKRIQRIISAAHLQSWLGTHWPSIFCYDKEKVNRFLVLFFKIIFPKQILILIHSNSFDSLYLFWINLYCYKMLLLIVL